MTIRTSPLGGAALGALLALAIAPAADAKTKHHHAAAAPADDTVRDEVEQLKAQVQSLEAWKLSRCCLASQALTLTTRNFSCRRLRRKFSA